MSGYKLRKRAESDLADVWRHTAARWGTEQAHRYLADILAAIDAIARDPRAGRPCDELHPGYFRRNVGSHAIFYRVAGARPEIVRVLHARRDFRRHLPKR